MREKTFSNSKPDENFIIENIRNGKCVVYFFENVEEVQDEEISYKYDLYRIEVTYRDNLQETIENNYEKWLAFAKDSDYERAAAEVRKRRDELLNTTDWTQMRDNSLSKEEMKKYQAYRQTLRDIPQQEGFPYDVVFPKIEVEKETEEEV